MKKVNKGLYYYLAIGTIGISLVLLAALRFRIMNDNLGFFIAFLGFLLMNSYIGYLEKKVGLSNKQIWIKSTISLLLFTTGFIIIW